MNEVMLARPPETAAGKAHRRREYQSLARWQTPFEKQAMWRWPEVSCITSNSGQRHQRISQQGSDSKQEFPLEGRA
jgi:hypothetical protein